MVGADLHATMPSPAPTHGDLAVAIDAGEVESSFARTSADFVGEDDVELFPLRLVFGQRQEW